MSALPPFRGRFDEAAGQAERTEFGPSDLATDSSETGNLAAPHPEKIYRDLKQRHVAWLRQFAGWSPDPLPQRVRASRPVGATEARRHAT